MLRNGRREEERRSRRRTATASCAGPRLGMRAAAQEPPDPRPTGRFQNAQRKSLSPRSRTSYYTLHRAQLSQILGAIAIVFEYPHEALESCQYLHFSTHSYPYLHIDRSKDHPNQTPFPLHSQSEITPISNRHRRSSHD